MPCTLCAVGPSMETALLPPPPPMHTQHQCSHTLLAVTAHPIGHHPPDGLLGDPLPSQASCRFHTGFVWSHIQGGMKHECVPAYSAGMPNGPCMGCSRQHAERENQCYLLTPRHQFRVLIHHLHWPAVAWTATAALPGIPAQPLAANHCRMQGWRGDMVVIQGFS